LLSTISKEEESLITLNQKKDVAGTSRPAPAPIERRRPEIEAPEASGETVELVFPEKQEGWYK
jgi:hypothetical protein